jgi:hypothetical protein
VGIWERPAAKPPQPRIGVVTDDLPWGWHPLTDVIKLIGVISDQQCALARAYEDIARHQWRLTVLYGIVWPLITGGLYVGLTLWSWWHG